MVIPLFKSHYSIGRSILTLEKAGSSDAESPASIIDICTESKIKNLYLVEDNMSGFLEAYLNSKSSDISLRFGLRLTVCPNHLTQDEDSLYRQSKYIIFANNKEGYRRLIKIYSFSAKNGFYYEPRIDFDTLKTLWDDKDLSLAVPFYDSFLHKNSLYGSICLPDFSFSKPTFFVEDNDLPFDPILTKLVNDYANKKYEIVRTKSIFYKNRKDFKSYLTFKCINKRTTLDKPEIEHMCSNEFSFEGWKEQNV